MTCVLMFVGLSRSAKSTAFLSMSGETSVTRTAPVDPTAQMALTYRRPKAGLLHHSDQGCQYTSRAYRQRLEQAGMIVSMSRKGNCWDNAVMELFFGSLKEECIGKDDLFFPYCNTIKI